MGGDGPAGFLDPVGFSWTILLLLLLGTLVLTIGSTIWMLLQPDEPELDTTPLVDEAVRRDQEAAALLRRRLDADAGRTDTTAPELR